RGGDGLVARAHRLLLALGHQDRDSGLLGTSSGFRHDDAVVCDRHGCFRDKESTMATETGPTETPRCSICGEAIGPGQQAHATVADSAGNPLWEHSGGCSPYARVSDCMPNAKCWRSQPHEFPDDPRAQAMMAASPTIDWEAMKNR